MVSLDNSLVTKLIFYPRKEAIPASLPPKIEILHIPVDKSTNIGGIFYNHNSDVPTLIIYHGNGETVLDYLQFSDIYFNIQLNVFFIDYRGYGFSEGKPRYTKLFPDALVTYDFITKLLEKKGYKNEIFVLGRSLGSVSASEIGSTNPLNLKGVIFESGFASLPQLAKKLFRGAGILIGERTLEKHSNHLRVAEIRSPILIIHGTNDSLIPFSQAELLKKSAISSNSCQLEPIEGAGHNDIFYYQEQYRTLLLEFIGKN